MHLHLMRVSKDLTVKSNEDFFFIKVSGHLLNLMWVISRLSHSVFCSCFLRSILYVLRQRTFVIVSVISEHLFHFLSSASWNIIS